MAAPKPFRPLYSASSTNLFEITIPFSQVTVVVLMTKS